MTNPDRYICRSVHDTIPIFEWVYKPLENETESSVIEKAYAYFRETYDEMGYSVDDVQIRITGVTRRQCEEHWSMVIVDNP